MSRNYKNILFVTLSITFACTLLACGGGSSSSDSSQPAESTTNTNVNSIGRVWTVAEILAESRMGGFGGEAKCGGELGFKRCVCTESVPSSIRYRPAVLECNGNAAAILHDNYLDIFSVVVRDSQNRDRWPAAGSGFGGCSKSLADSDAPPNYCSAFKVQNSFEIAGGTARVHCFGDSGYSTNFADVVRMTIKLSDSPFSSDDDIERHCLYAGNKPLN
jgi:hypothetical protein